ncbi:MAG TPA: class I SAM-dependent methyltransferase [Polyangiaceae bacterium]
MVEPYDVVPYTNHAYAESHPDRLAVVARLNRFEPPALESARVLEIACGRGGNLIPMAAGMPRATFVGADRSTRQIEEASAVARATGLEHVTFRAADFETIAPSEPFDYVIAHGLWSWISLDARRALFRVIASVLAPHGIAYVSFNVLPGWYERLAARDYLRAFATPATAKKALGDLIALVWPEEAAYKASLARVAARIAETDEAYVTHEYFSSAHHPATVGEFLDEAGAAGLRYLGDAIAQDTALELAPPELFERAAKAGVRDAQQLVDFARATAFRRALLVRADAGGSFAPSLDAAALDAMTATSRLRPGHAPDEVIAGDLTVQITDAARPALAAIARAAPRAAAIDPTWSQELFDLWLVTRAIDLHLHAPPLDDGSATRPRACPVARWHAGRGGPITNRWHHEIVFRDEITRRVLAALDGTRTADDVASALGEPGDLVRAAIAQLASLALLIPA